MPDATFTNRAALREQVAAAIAEQFTPDGKTTQGMRVSFQGPDGWPATRQPNPSEVADAVLAVLPETDQPGLLAKVDEATATLRRIRSTIRTLRDRGATGRVYYQSITDDLAGPRPDRDEASSPSRMADEAQQPETQAFVCKCPAEICHCGHHAAAAQQPKEASAVLLSSRCDACRHTLNWHRNDVGCTVTLCVCGRFQLPATEERTP